MLCCLLHKFSVEGFILRRRAQYSFAWELYIWLTPRCSKKCSHCFKVKLTNENIFSLMSLSMDCDVKVSAVQLFLRTDKVQLKTANGTIPLPLSVVCCRRIPICGARRCIWPPLPVLNSLLTLPWLLWKLPRSEFKPNQVMPTL